MQLLFKDIAAILEGFYHNLTLIVICTPEKIAVPICLQHELIISNSKQKSRKDNQKTGANKKKSEQRVKLHDSVGYVLKGIIFCTAVTDNGRFLKDFSKKSNSSRSVGWMNCD
jgi:hypothetical protein